MAITINGSGTVTGLAVGGLPDGTVDAGTLATDSVVTGKIADGTIANADIADLAASKLTGALPAISGASLTGLTSSQMPTGSVLQFVSGVDDTSRDGTGEMQSDAVTITPSSSSSVIFLSFNMALETRSSPTDRGITVKILRGSTVIYAQTYELYASVSNASSQRISNTTYTLKDSPSSTSAVSYTFKITATSGIARMNQYGKSFLSVFEIGA